MNTASPASDGSRPSSLGGRLLMLAGLTLGLMLLNLFVGRLAPIDASGDSPLRDAMVNIVHNVVYFGATVSNWALFVLLVYMVVRWVLGTPILDALRS